MSNNELTIKYGTIVFAGLTAYFAPIVLEMLFVGALVVFDWITGIAKARKNKQFESGIAIRKFWVSIGYFIGILVARVLETYLGDQVPLVKPLVMIVAVSEIQSLRENLKELTGTDIFKYISQIFSKKQ